MKSIDFNHVYFISFDEDEDENSANTVKGLTVYFTEKGKSLHGASFLFVPEHSTQYSELEEFIEAACITSYGDSINLSYITAFWFSCDSSYQDVEPKLNCVCNIGDKEVVESLHFKGHKLWSKKVLAITNMLKIVGIPNLY